MNHQGKSLSLAELDAAESDIESGIIIPCDINAIRRIHDFMHMQKLLVRNESLSEAKGPYYFSMDMSIDNHFERAAKASAFGGPFTAYGSSMHRFDKGEEKIYTEEGHKAYSSNPQQIPFARYNCWTLCQGVTQYVAGLDLSDIHRNIPYYYRANSMESWITEFFLADEILLGKDNYQRTVIDDDILFARQKQAPPFLL